MKRWIKLLLLVFLGTAIITIVDVLGLKLWIAFIIMATIISPFLVKLALSDYKEMFEKRGLN